MSMNASVSVAALRGALNIVRAATTRRSSLPALRHVMVEAIEDRLILTGTNLQVVLRRAVAADIFADGAVLVDASILWEMLSVCPSSAKATLFSADGDTSLTVTCGDMVASLVGLALDEYPDLQDAGQSDPVLHIPNEILRRAIRLVPWVASADESRPILSGVKICVRNGLISFSASDGYRITCFEAEMDADVDVEFVVMASALKHIGGLISKDADEVTIHVVKGTRLIATVGDSMVTSYVIDGSFPDMSSLVPKTFITTAVVDGERMAWAIRQAGVFARRKNELAHISMDPEDGSMRVRSTVGAVGSVESHMSGIVTGETIDIAFNMSYIAQFLRATRGNEIKIEIQSYHQAAVFTSAAFPGFLHVVMPMIAEPPERGVA